MNEQFVAFPKDQCEVSQYQQVYNCYDIYIDEEIKDIPYYRQALQIIRGAAEGDLIRIHISSPGGNLNSAVVLRNAILDCQADVVAIIEAEAYSAASLLALSCPSIEVKPYATMMCHSASFGSAGSVQNVRDHVEFTGRHAESIMEEVYNKFLTPEEFQELKKGCELWFDYKQINERLENMFNQEDSEEHFEHKTLEEMISESVESVLHRVLDQREKQATAKAKKAAKSIKREESLLEKVGEMVIQ